MRLPLVAVGGTFDHFHKGHESLLLKAFDLGEVVIVGVTSDAFARKMGKEEIQDFNQRMGQVKAFLIVQNLFERARLIELNDAFGPLLEDPEICGVIVTQETLGNAKMANRMRVERNMRPLKIFVQEFLLAEDGKPISSSRIRNKEIDERGYMLRKN
ncbi:MAG: pantetheine-phosphate adenylyltransferase [Candidatus Methanosuratincola petrocarbonis]|nr:pantetheine-phosphate adenylyltransferase [Candidatus Methanosuratincola sp.]